MTHKRRTLGAVAAWLAASTLTAGLYTLGHILTTTGIPH